MAGNKMMMKLLVDKITNKVLFAEAGKECVDFLFHILSLPLGTVVGFLKKESMVGSIGSLYGSLESLGNDYLLSGVSKSCLLEPRPAAGSAVVPLLEPIYHLVSDDLNSKTFYMCDRFCNDLGGYNNAKVHPHMSATKGAKCPECKQPMTCVVSQVEEVKAKGSTIVGGYVKGAVTYMIMDDLSVEPISSMITAMTMLTKLNVKDVGGLEERRVTLNMESGMELLKASLLSKAVLTDVFLCKKAAGTGINVPAKS